MAEVLFYHLMQMPLERVLPDLLERSLQRGWRAVVQVGNEERLEPLNSVLWTYKDDSFLPHGTQADGPPDMQPIFLTTQDENPNEANVLFLVDGAPAGDLTPYDRVVLLFDGNNPEAVTKARTDWQQIKAGGHDATYWQQSDQGRWEKKA